MALYTDPIPQLGQLYPVPLPVADGAAAFLALFDGWALPLESLRQQALGVQNNLGAVYANLSEMVNATTAALGVIANSQLYGMTNALGYELGQPNPAGVKFPFSFTVQQLPQATSPTWGMGTWLETQIGLYAQWLDFYLRGGAVPPVEPW